MLKFDKNALVNSKIFTLIASFCFNTELNMLQYTWHILVFTPTLKFRYKTTF